VDQVISQEPSAGISAAKGATIILVVSDGPAPITLPDIIGMEFAAARVKLEALGFVVTVTSKENDGSHAAGIVASVMPGIGTSHAKGTQIFVTVWGKTDGTPWQESTTPSTAASSTNQ
jgi:serine/threonine-protein kinase